MKRNVKPDIDACWLVGLALMLLIALGCGAQYKAMADAAQSELSPMALANDDRHKIQIHQALVADQGFSGLTLSVQVFMERAYIVGHVDSKEQAAAILQTVRKVQGIRSVEGYLPVKASAPDSGSSMSTSNMSLKAQIEAALALEPAVVKSRIHVDVLDGHVVLLGVVSGNEERHSAEKAAAGVSGVKTVTNWLLLPEQGYMSIRPRIR